MKTLENRLGNSGSRKPVSGEESSFFSLCIFGGHTLVVLAVCVIAAQADSIRAPIGTWRGENGELLTIGTDHSFSLQRSGSQMRASYALPDVSHIKVEFVTRAGTNSTTYSFTAYGNELLLTNDASQKVTRFHKTDEKSAKVK